MEIKKTEKKGKSKAKYVANVSLAAMGAGFIATLPFEPTTTLKIVQGGFEAGLVGGLADWFAVTALFRHPLNIPIPHTALLPKNRKRITNAILNIIENDFLTKESILAKLNDIPLADTVLEKLEHKLQDKDTHTYLQNALQFTLSSLEIEKVENMVKDSLIHISHNIDTSKVMTHVIDKAIESKYDEKIFTLVFQVVEKKVSDPEVKGKITDFVIQKLNEKAENSFFKMALKPLVSVGKDKLSSTIEKAIDDFLEDLKHEDSENRQSMLTYIRHELTQLKTNDDILQKVEDKKQAFFKDEQFEKMTHYLTETILTKVSTMIEEPTFVTEKVVPLLKSLLLKIKTNEEWVQKLDSALKQTIGNLVEQNHDKIGALVKDNIEKLNQEQLIDMMENKIGKELSWIRVNGSICGFFIGVILSLIKVLV